MRRMTGASLNGRRPAQISTSDWRGEKAWRSIPKRARSNRLAAVAMNSMAQQAVPKGMGHRELARDWFTAQLMSELNLVVSQLSEPLTVSTCFIRSPSTIFLDAFRRRRPSTVSLDAFHRRLSSSVPFKRSPLPHVQVAHEQDRQEHQHFGQQEPHPRLAGAAEVDGAPGDQ